LGARQFWRPQHGRAHAGHRLAGHHRQHALQPIHRRASQGTLGGDDALGGRWGNTDRTQPRSDAEHGKGPAVQALRAQADKALYHEAMRRVLERQPNLTIKAALVEGLLAERGERGDNGSPPTVPGKGATIAGVRTQAGERLRAHCVVVTTGTFLQGRLVCGDGHRRRYGGARRRLSGELARLGLRLPPQDRDAPPWTRAA
jgi:tRNA uridine 5-carboxymethylaminomethyl modification enzyme